MALNSFSLKFRVELVKEAIYLFNLWNLSRCFR